MALASVWATTLATQAYGPFVMAICAILVGMGAGIVNGILIAYGRMVPFIATLAMLVAARGLAQRMSDRKTQLLQPENNAIESLSTTRVLGIPLVVFMFAAVAVIGWLLLNRTTFGRRTFAVGGNPEAARLAGIDVRRHTLLLYALSGLCCGIAAIIIMARTTTGSSTHGDLYELDAIAAVIIGGTLLTGGKGTLVGSILGLLVFTVITNLFILNGLDTSDQLIAKGVIIVIAVLLQRRGLRTPT
jgi:ribose transport system permease protein